MFRKSSLEVVLITIILMVAIPSSIFPLTRASPSYSPGVHVGDYVTFGQISHTQTGSGPVPSGLQIIIDSKNITDTVTSVDSLAKTVGAIQTYNFKNGTSLTMHLFGNVADGSGNLSLFIFAGGLKAGDSPTASHTFTSFFSFFTATVTREYAGALRSVNLFSFGNSPQAGLNSLDFAWDQQTGFLLEAAENVTATSSSTPQFFTIDIKTTNTNVWGSSSTPDFSFDAAFNTVPDAYRGQTIGITLNLTSINNYSPTIGLAPVLLNSSIANPPSLSLKQNTVTLAAGKSATDSLTFSTGASTSLGLYLFSVNATVGSTPHGAAVFAVYVLPPDFQLAANPQSLTVAPGSTAHSTITVSALGLFSGQVSLSTSSSSLLGASLDKSTVTLTLSVTSVNVTVTVSPSQYTLPEVDTLSVDGSSPNQPIVSAGLGFSSHFADLSVNVTGPNFQMSVPSGSLVLQPGGTGSEMVTFSSLDGFSGTVDLAGSTYGGLGFSFSPASVVLTGGSTVQSKITVSAPAGEPSGYYSVNVVGIGGVLERFGYVSVSVGGPDFLLSPDSYNLVWQSGKNNVNSTITITSVNGFAGTLSLTATSYGAPVGWALNTTSVTLSPGGAAHAKLTISNAPKVTGLDYAYLYVYASNATATRSTYLSVGPPGLPFTQPTVGPDFALVAFPSSISLARGAASSSVRVAFVSLLGFKGTVTLYTSISPPIDAPFNTCPGASCITADLNRTTVTLGPGSIVNATLNVSVPLTALPGTFFVTAGGTNSTLFRSTSISVNVVTPDFQVFLNLNGLDIVRGKSAAPTIIVESLDNFAGSVTISTNVTDNLACPGVNCPTLSPGTSTLSLTKNSTAATPLTVSTSASTPLGYYSINIAAKNSTNSHFNSITLQVYGPDFALQQIPDPSVTTPGGSGSVSIAVSGLDGYSGTVTLKPIFPNGVTVSSSPVNVIVPAGGTVSHAFTYTTTSHTPGGYGFNVNATDGTLVHEIGAYVLSAGPDFGLFINGTSYFGSQTSIVAGHSVAIPLTLASLNGFSGSITLTVQQLYGPSCPGPNCPTTSFNPAIPTLTPAQVGLDNLTVAIPAAATPGQYTLILNATSGLISHANYIYVQVNAPPALFVSIVRGADGSLWSSQLSGLWTKLSSITGLSKSTPAICSSTGRADLVVRGLNNATYHKSFVKGAWSTTWDSPPGGLTNDQPACAVLNGVLYVVIRGTDNETYWITKDLTTGTWSSWQSLGAIASAAPVLVANPTYYRLDLVIRGPDGGIWHNSLSTFSNTWAGWDSVGGVTTGVPALVSDGSNLILVVKGSDDALWYNTMSVFGGPWSGYVYLAGATSVTPSLAVDGSGTVYLVVTGVGNVGSLWLKTYSSGVWSSWHPLGGIVTSAPSLIITGTNLGLTTALVSAQGLDGGVWYASLLGTNNVGWATAGGITEGDPVLGIGS